MFCQSAVKLESFTKCNVTIDVRHQTIYKSDLLF